MRSLVSLFKRAAAPAALRVKNGDTFAGCAERLGLTAREGEIVRLLLEGQDSKKIGETLFISDHTVKNHIHNVYQKLSIRNRIQLVRSFQPALEDSVRLPEGAPASRGVRVVRRAALPAAVLLLVLAAGLVAWRPWGLRPRPAAFPPPPAVAVLDFENLSGNPELDKWETGLPLLLATDLSQSKRIRTVTDDTVYSALQKFEMTGRSRYTREEFRRLAKEIKADYLVSGTLMAAGGAVVVTANLQDARTGETVESRKLECRDDQDLLRKSDGLAQLIRARLGRAASQGRDDIDIDIEVLTTSSALAYKYYIEGWRYNRTGDYEQSLIMLQKAVEIDPEFAMAYRMMSSSARNLRLPGRYAEYMRKAFDLSAKLPEDCRERHLIRADYYARSEATLDLAVAEFKRVLQDHPYDLVANNNLGILLYGMEDYEGALKYADVPVREGTSDPFPHYTKALALFGLGRTEEAIHGLAAYHENNPANRLIHQTLVECLFDQGDLERASAALEKAMAVFPDPSWAYWKGGLLFESQGAAAAREEIRRLFLMDEAPMRLRAHVELMLVELATGRYTDAARECQDGAELADAIGEAWWSMDFRLLRGQILVEQGRLEEALIDLRAALDLAAEPGAMQRAAMHALARAALRAGDPRTVDALTQRFRTAVASGNKPQTRDFDFFLGVLALERGQAQEAVAAFERAAALYPSGRPVAARNPLLIVYLGQAREKAGDPAGALEAYESLLKVAKPRVSYGELTALSVLGKARTEESLGRAAEAVENYRSFLRLWVDGDPDRPEIAEARSRLAALAGRPASGR